MNYLEFVAAVVGALAWPVATIVLAFLVRSPLRRVLLSLTRLKYKDMEIDFGRELSRIEAEAKSIDLTPAPVPEPYGHGPENSTEQLREAARLTNDFPEPAVALGWAAVEQELQAAAIRLRLAVDQGRSAAPLRIIPVLRADGYLDDRMNDILNRMRNLRNMAVHGSYSGQPVTADEAREFLALAGGVIERLKALRKESEG